MQENRLKWTHKSKEQDPYINQATEYILVQIRFSILHRSDWF